MSKQGGENDHREGGPRTDGRPNWDALDRETRWELIGCIILLVVAVAMAVAVNVYGP